MESHPEDRVIKQKKFPNTRKPSHWWVCGEFWTLREQHNREEKINKTYRLRTQPQLPAEK